MKIGKLQMASRITERLSGVMRMNKRVSFLFLMLLAMLLSTSCNTLSWSSDEGFQFTYESKDDCRNGSFHEFLEQDRRPRSGLLH
jgi:hypothetical protein